ncbi:hypothetical protein IAR55_007161 [Kwoniella newhampshirensis]|uniref:Uncharacterized protein n=1 Tax=Kwoniella newhampshirensis TaxID=1651941 RepID=A0AAW0YE60_9TREE
MRVTIPNPLGPPITFDSDHVHTLISKLPHLPSSLHRRPHFKLFTLIFSLILLITIRPSPPFPESFAVEWRNERRLPQLGVDVKFPEGKNGRFVSFDVPRGTGFNHQLQRVLLQHHLAVLGNRSLAFEPYVEDDSFLPFNPLSWPWRNSKIPLSAFISTVISGFESFYNSPRAVPAWYYRANCSGRKQRVYTIRSESNPTGDLELVGDGQARIHQLQVLLAGSDVGCIRIKGEPFDDEFFDSKAPLDLYESFVRSPAMKHFSFAPTVLSILNDHMDDIAPEQPLYDLDAISHTTSNAGVKSTMWKHILALHIRRGPNWEAVCEEKGQRAAPFVSFNKLPLLPGNENVPPPPTMVEAARMGLYRAKCLPQTLDIIGRARRMRKNHPLLKSVYILTDAEDSWISEIRMWLQSDGWNHVWIGKNDFYPGWDEREVGVAVDMEVARRAGVFVGNGFSMTSSNIVLLRSRDGIHPDLTQFW